MEIVNCFLFVFFCLRSFFPVLMHFLHLLRARDTLCSFDLNHAAHLFSLMEKIVSVKKNQEYSHAHWTLVKDGASFVAAFVIKLLAILSRRNTAELYDHVSTQYDIFTSYMIMEQKEFNQISNHLSFSQNIKTIIYFFFQDLSLAAISKGLEFIGLVERHERFPGVVLALKNFIESSGYSEITNYLT